MDDERGNDGRRKRNRRLAAIIKYYASDAAICASFFPSF